MWTPREEEERIQGELFPNGNPVKVYQSMVLERQDDDLAEWVTNERMKVVEENNLPDLYQSKTMTPRQCCYIGTCGEIIFCRMQNVMPNLDVSGDCGGFDAYCPQYGYVDVKTNDYHPGWIVINEKGPKKEWPDKFVKMSFHEGKYHLIGWMSAEEAFKEKDPFPPQTGVTGFGGTEERFEDAFICPTRPAKPLLAQRSKELLPSGGYRLSPLDKDT